MICGSRVCFGSYLCHIIFRHNAIYDYFIPFTLGPNCNYVSIRSWHVMIHYQTSILNSLWGFRHAILRLCIGHYGWCSDYSLMHQSTDWRFWDLIRKKIKNLIVYQFAHCSYWPHGTWEWYKCIALLHLTVWHNMMISVLSWNHNIMSPELCTCFLLCCVLLWLGRD